MDVPEAAKVTESYLLRQGSDDKSFSITCCIVDSYGDGLQPSGNGKLLAVEIT
jgi:hypothetical protein